MKEIQNKIQELLTISKEKTKGWEILKSKMNRQDDLMDELKALAKANKTLLGRIVKFPHADSYAVYVITKVNKKTVRLDWVDYCDGWQDDRCGIAASLDIRYATQKIQGEDRLEEMFTYKKE